MNIDIVRTVQGVNLDIKVVTDLVVLADDSGYGKTYLMKLLAYVYRNDGKLYRYFSYSDVVSRDLKLVRDKIIKDISMYKWSLLLFDNADLYFNNDVLSVAREYSDLIVVSCHSTVGRFSCMSDDMYDICFSNNSIVVRQSRGVYASSL